MNRIKSRFFWSFLASLCLAFALCMAMPQPVNAQYPSRTVDMTREPQQVIFVSIDGKKAKLSMYTQKQNGKWKENLTTTGYIGKNGVGKYREGDQKTPLGTYALTSAFGLQQDPGTSLPYVHINQHYYWVNDVNSRYYDQLVNNNTVLPDWNAAEHLSDYPKYYDYAIVIGYNVSHTEGNGSGIFLHCSDNKPTAGGIAIPKDKMIEILKLAKPGAVITIDLPDQIKLQRKALLKD
jgi:L,D-peptidoglycan transpeptidase YkuD (ErfK/YbiS/YcfS/YnhG family)